MGPRQAQAEVACEQLTLGPPKPCHFCALGRGWVCALEVLPAHEPSLALLPESTSLDFLTVGQRGWETQ